MMAKLYKEKQRYHDWVVISFLVLATLGLFLSGASYFWRTDVTITYAVSCFILASGLGYAVWWLTRIQSKLVITDKKIKLQFNGAIEATKKIYWDDIENCTIVQTGRFLKWNRPKVTMTDERFYSLDGRNGLMIETKDGKHYFIGCQNVDELQEAINSNDQIWELIES
ncbi:hypothetical protein CEQ90_17995 [Lewinellaceae bacterium SD302]|nr:hypothetical protein CEQ90_17995 [Lewinellaceae bacterium SD302]